MLPQDFDIYIASLKDKLALLGGTTVSVKKINYGQQLICQDGKQKIVLSIYNGKKGLKTVWGGAGGVLQERAEALLAGVEVKPATYSSVSEDSLSLLTQEEGFDYLWCGSDESGKGDFFGPLVVAAVLVNKDIATKLEKFGVRDSKELTDDKIKQLADKIEALAPVHAVLALRPREYNLRYAELKKQGKNLNDLLSGGHAAALKKVLKADANCHFALVDRFTMHNNIAQQLALDFPWVKVVQQPKAEKDMAVAAASILARAKFVEIMDELSSTLGMNLPKGGGEQATNCAQEIASSKGVAILNSFVKVHFANFTRLHL